VVISLQFIPKTVAVIVNVFFHIANLRVLFIYSSTKWLCGESASGGCVVASGYKIFKNATDSEKYVECVDKQCTIGAYYHYKSRSGTRVGLEAQTIAES